MRDSWPQDKLIAVAMLIAAMTPDSRIALSNVKREDLLPDHTGMSDFIRQHFGLWEGNTALIESCGCDSLDRAPRASGGVQLFGMALHALPQRACARTARAILPTACRRGGGSRGSRPLRAARPHPEGNAPAAERARSSRAKILQARQRQRAGVCER